MTKIMCKNTLQNVCVGNKEHISQNLQTVKHQHNNIPLSEVGIPILILKSVK
jgi:hypothetical protein